mmetsp:Transcript_9977/g.18730  ORF Transcript_9977/g.18730 Transcript_9977/m.18730 type:complete len:343 (+) Transcript_9977:15-1043(+)
MLKGRRMSKSNHLTNQGIKDISFHNSHQSSNMNALASIISPSLRNNTNTIIPHSRTTTTSGTTTHRPVSRSVSEDSVSSSHSSQKSIDYQSKKKRKTSHHPKDSSKRITTSSINSSKNSSSNNQEVIILDENHDTNHHYGASSPSSTPIPINKSLANILEKDHERSLRVAALLKKTHSLSSSPSPLTNIKKQELLKHNAMMANVNINDNFHGIQNTCTISPTIISNPQSSTISVSTNSSSSSSGNKSCHNKVALQTKDIPPSKQQQEQEHIVTKNKHRKRGRPTIRSNIMAYDSKKYTVKELKRVAKKSREICNAMEQREQKRLDELANRLFESSSSDEKEE